MTGNVLFIGAGASFGARLDEPTRPPLGPELCPWLRRISSTLVSDLGLVDLRSTIEYAQEILDLHPNEKNYETLIANLDRKGRLALHNLLQVAFSDLSEKRTKIDIGFHNHADGYDKLIQKLEIGSKPWTIVSLNYDLLIEEAMNRLGIEFHYPSFPRYFGQDQSKFTSVRIYKPHGSINFFAHADQKVFHHEPLPTDDRGLPIGFFTDKSGNHSPTYPIAMAAMPGVENVLWTANSSSISEPVMANYTMGKAADTNQETLEGVRRDALAAFSIASEVVTVGVRPILDRKDDQFVSDIFALPLRGVTYVAGDEAECRIVKARFPEARTVSNGLNAYLQS